jgi:hypothetical protein
VDFRVSEVLDGINSNATLRVTLILVLPQMVSSPRRSHDTPYIDDSKCIIITSDEYEATLEHKQDIL